MGVVCPRELQLGVVNGHKATLGMMHRIASIAGAEHSFEAAAVIIGELCGVRVSPEMVERATEMIGALIAADEKAGRCQASPIRPTKSDAAVRESRRPPIREASKIRRDAARVNCGLLTD